MWIQQTPDSQFDKILAEVQKLRLYPADLTGLDPDYVITKQQIGFDLDQIDKLAED